MNLVSQLQRHYEWTPNYRLVFKKPVPPGLKTFKVPQTTGVSGWLIFTYENNIPVTIWASQTESKKVRCSVDERLCGDTFLKVERVAPNDYVVADIWMYNSNCVFACSTYEQRYNWLKKLLNTFVKHIPSVTIRLIHKSDAEQYPIRGYEEHPVDNAGKPGYFIEKDDSTTVEVSRLSMPDCYEVNGKGYLKVPDIKTAFYLRSLGERFQCRCVPAEENSWVVVENIPDVE